MLKYSEFQLIAGSINITALLKTEDMAQWPALYINESVQHS